MLDLSAYNIRKFNVKFKGEVLNLLPPMLKQVKVINDHMKVISLGVTGDELKEAATLILNRNDKGKKFNTSTFEDEPFDVAFKLVTSYVAWVNEIYENPNSKSPLAEQ